MPWSSPCAGLLISGISSGHQLLVVVLKGLKGLNWVFLVSTESRVRGKERKMSRSGYWLVSLHGTYRNQADALELFFYPVNSPTQPDLHKSLFSNGIYPKSILPFFLPSHLKPPAESVLYGEKPRPNAAYSWLYEARTKEGQPQKGQPTRLVT